MKSGAPMCVSENIVKFKPKQIYVPLTRCAKHHSPHKAPCDTFYYIPIGKLILTRVHLKFAQFQNFNIK